jgi:enterochelin esterase-like enzyme
MKIEFPSREFDDAVAAVCHGLASEEEARALNELLRLHMGARDEYILRVELHTRLASQLDLFVPGTVHEFPSVAAGTSPAPHRRAGRKVIWAAALAACIAVVAAIGWKMQRTLPSTTRDTPPARVASLDDWKPSVTNRPGEDYPRINSERRVQFRIKAPNANHVSVIIASSDMGSPHTITRSNDGIWTITTSPIGIGFHFYRVLIDGVSVADPATQIFRGGGGDWLSSAIEIPTGEDFHELKDVPHGEVREQQYYSRITDSWRRAFVYTPPGYDRDLSARYPVLYLLHGRGEDETSWPVQGRVNWILDNLISEQRARPMIVVMDRGIAVRPGEPETSFRQAGDTNQFPTLEEVFVTELVPMIDQTFRTSPDREHRALAGLSVGAAQAFAIGLRHFDKFANVGSFSFAGGLPARSFDPRTSYGGVMMDADAFNRQMRVLFLSVGEDEPDRVLSNVEQYYRTLRDAGIDHVFYESSATGHEWHTWRRSLREFASLLFKN